MFKYLLCQIVLNTLTQVLYNTGLTQYYMDKYGTTDYSGRYNYYITKT